MTELNAFPSSEEEEDIKIYDDFQVSKKLIHLKQSAETRGILFSLKFSTVKKLLNAKKCYYTGKVFTSKGLYSRSIDRVDASKGYTDDNVVSCTTYINSKKTNLTVEEILAISKKIEQRIKKKKKKNGT